MVHVTYTSCAPLHPPSLKLTDLPTGHKLSATNYSDTRPGSVYLRVCVCVYICMHMQVAGLEYLPTVRVGLLNRKNLAGEGERMPREASRVAIYYPQTAASYNKLFEIRLAILFIMEEGIRLICFQTIISRYGNSREKKRGNNHFWHQGANFRESCAKLSAKLLLRLNDPVHIRSFN